MGKEKFITVQINKTDYSRIVVSFYASYVYKLTVMRSLYKYLIKTLIINLINAFFDFLI
jgi:hypothetical protein